MESLTELQLNPYVAKAGDKVKIILITDIKLHSSQKRNTTSVGKAFGKSLRTEMPGRLYRNNTNISNIDEKNKTFKLAIPDIFSQDENLKREVKYWQDLGYKVLLQIPKEIPIYAGEDLKEFMNSVNGKRIQRKTNLKID